MKSFSRTFRNKRDSIIAVTTKVSHSYSFYI